MEPCSAPRSQVPRPPPGEAVERADAWPSDFENPGRPSADAQDFAILCRQLGGVCNATTATSSSEVPLCRCVWFAAMTSSTTAVPLRSARWTKLSGCMCRTAAKETRLLQLRSLRPRPRLPTPSGHRVFQRPAGRRAARTPRPKQPPKGGKASGSR